MEYTDFGTLKLNECNDANIPVNCFLMSPADLDLDKWVWFADNFMPRKKCCDEKAYIIEANTKKDIIKAINKYVVPLYKVALKNIKNGTLYYWY